MNRHLGEFEQTLLYAVLHLQDADAGAHGPSIRQAIEDRTGRAVSPGAIYTAMNRLEQRGFITSELGDSTPERGGKRKRHYRLRAAGATALRQVEERLARMSRGARLKA